MSSITISLDACIEDMETVVLFLNGLIEKQKREQEEWKQKRRVKKKTKEEILEDIKEELEILTNDIESSKVEIENLELKRSELLKEPEIPLKIKKIKVVRKKKIEINPNEPLLTEE